MVRSRQRRRPYFFWQPLLILFPVAVLAALGFHSLRQDKIIAQHDAVERAQGIADSLLPRLWSVVTNADQPEAFEHNAFQVDAAGELLFPPPVSLTPSPEPLDANQLAAEQARLWEQAERAELSDQKIPESIQVVRKFLEAKPPERFAAVATYNLAILLAKQRQPQAAADTLQSLLDKYPHAVAESGLPLDRLAEFKLLELSTIITNNSPPAKVLISADDFCRRIIFDPSPLTPPFLSWVSAHAQAFGLKDGNDYWNSLWREYEESRRLYASARSDLLRVLNVTSKMPTDGSRYLLWLSADDQKWLAIGFNGIPTTITSHLISTRSAPMQWRGKMIFGPNRNKNFTEVEFSGPKNDSYHGFTNQWFLCRTELQISQTLLSLLGDQKQIPEYFALGLEIAGKQLPEFRPDARLSHTNILASAIQSDRGVPQLKVSVYPTSPAALFKRQSERTFWFGSLVSIASLAAFIGLFSAWRAFNRQQELAEMKSNFVSSVSHELRAPIASVRLMAESLERGKVAEPPKQQEYFRFIGQECRRLSSLIENVLDFSRIEQGRKQYEFEPTDLLALVQQTVKLMEAYGNERQVAIALKLPDHQPSTFDNQLSLDGRAIQQALINLLDNAIKHSPNGQTVSVVLESPARITHLSSEALLAKEDHESLIHISVIDHGPGIPAAEHEKIFQRFYRLGSELRRETQGVGIGLSIVKHIVEAHGGRVVVESAPGTGSRFTIELPFTNPAPRP
jgi:signal transduction histidine kinase